MFHCEQCDVWVHQSSTQQQLSQTNLLFHNIAHPQTQRMSSLSLLELSDTILLDILWYLSPQEVSKASLICHRLHRVTNLAVLWRRFAKSLEIPEDFMPHSMADLGSLTSAVIAQKASQSTIPWKYSVIEYLSTPPQATGQSGSNPNYGPIKVGSVIVLKKHREVEGNSNWNSSMDAFIGKVAVVTKLSGVDSRGCPGVRVSIDGKSIQYFFRIRDVRVIKR